MRISKKYMWIRFLIFVMFGIRANVFAQKNIKVYYLTTEDTAFIETMRELGGVTSLKKTPPNPGKYFVTFKGGVGVLLEFMVNDDLTLCGEHIMYSFYSDKILSYHRYCNCSFFSEPKKPED